MLAPPPSEQPDVPTSYLVAASEPLVIEALNARREELKLSMITLDDASGFSPGTSSKYISPDKIKNFGLTSYLKMCRGLGLRVVLEVDDRLTDEIVDCSVARMVTQAGVGNVAQPPGRRTVQRVIVDLQRRDKRNGRRSAWPSKSQSAERSHRRRRTVRAEDHRRDVYRARR